jgi:hypothetical protein
MGAKKYTVSWRTPEEEGEVSIETPNLAAIPTLVWNFWEGKPPGCPTLITKIELVDPEQYLTPVAVPPDHNC